jgi:DNA mismatch repair protein MutS2
MSDGGVVGKILSIQGKKAEVVFGSLRTFVDMAKLVKATKPKETISTQVSSVSKSTSDSSRKRQLAFSTEIDLRGMRVDEALQAMVYFLDDAVQFNASRLRILHGTGTGALKVAIRQLLKTNPNVSSFADEDVRFGGAGITVVNLN